MPMSTTMNRAPTKTAMTDQMRYSKTTAGTEAHVSGARACWRPHSYHARLTSGYWTPVIDSDAHQAPTSGGQLIWPAKPGILRLSPSVQWYQ